MLKIKEPGNALTHFATFIASIAGLVFLIILSKNNVSKLVTMTIYGVSVIFLYGVSSLYHWIKVAPQKTELIRKLDHVAIYLLIAGSYTPVFYYGLTGAWKWTMLIAVWLLALIGVFIKLCTVKIPRHISTAFYITLGWIALIPFLQLFQNLPVGAVYLMITGGVAYTIGAIIYATKCFNFFPNRFGFHEIFHLFVMAGSIIHFIMMLEYFVPL
jgi:hemolysin III